MCSMLSAHLFYYSCSLMFAQSVCMCALSVLEVHVKERERVTTCVKTSRCVGHIVLSVLKAERKKTCDKTCMRACTRISICTQKAHFIQQHVHTHTHIHTKRRLPMRQMRSERSHIKQPNLSCFAFIAPVHFHNALKPPLRRE